MTDPSNPRETSAAAIADVASIRALLIAAARRREAVSYSELLILLGHRFTRPKMRALCKTLDAIDAHGGEAGEPELAVLVVRESDGLPGLVGGRSSRARRLRGALDRAASWGVRRRPTREGVRALGRA